MADPGKFNDWTTVFVTVGSIVAGLVGVTASFWSWIQRALRSVVLSDHMHLHFGDKPVDAVKEIYQATQRCTSIAEVQRELLSDKLDLGFFVCETTGEYIWSNHVLQSMFELDSTKMRGFGWLERIDEKARVHELWLYCIQNRIPYSTTYGVHQDDGTVRQAHAKAYACVAADNTLLAYVGYVAWVDEEVIK